LTEHQTLSTTTYAFQLTPYEMPFRRPLVTNHGTWSHRTGAILTLTHPTGQQNPIAPQTQSEIAPLPSFGSETLADALQWLEPLNGRITTQQIYGIPSHLPCCQFAFETALHPATFAPHPMAALLPAGEAVLSSWQTLYARGDRTFKWKIGCRSNELALFEKLLSQLPTDAQLRLDANGGLTLAQAQDWLMRCDRASNIEYLEQPLPPSEFADLLKLSAQFKTKLALDESIASLQQLETAYHQGWRGIFVIKPAIVGSPKKLIEFCQKFQIDSVFSSVFETTIGRQQGIALAQKCGSVRPLGYGTADWLIED
jgi:o-succinylbenzoate synthase